MAQTSTPTANTPSAASRVFGIPELLENILIYSANMSLCDPQKSLRMRPAKELFVFQRVNCTFRNVIQQSKHLRQAMFLEHTEGEAPLPDPINIYCALNWLCGIKPHGMTGDGIWTPEVQLLLGKPRHDRLRVKCVQERLVREHIRWASDEYHETWTSMKIFRTSFREPVTLCMRVRVTRSAKARQWERTISFAVSVDPQCTLGDLMAFYEVLTKNPWDQWVEFWNNLAGCWYEKVKVKPGAVVEGI